MVSTSTSHRWPDSMSGDESDEPAWTEKATAFWYDGTGQNRWDLDRTDGIPRVEDTGQADKTCEACGQSNCRFVCFIIHPERGRALVGDRCIRRATKPGSPDWEKIKELTGQSRRSAANAASAGRRSAAKLALAARCRSLANDPRVSAVGAHCPWRGHGRTRVWLPRCLREYADLMASGGRANREHQETILEAARRLVSA
jgi:hypothetical protein